MGVEIVLQVAALIVAIVATTIGFAWGFFVYKRQANAQVFLEYTKRYNEIMDSFPSDALQSRFRLADELPVVDDKLTLVVLRYLNLCSEEFYLWKEKILDKKIWQIWEDEMKRTLRKPLYRREWETLKGEFSSYEEFSCYVEKVLAS